MNIFKRVEDVDFRNIIGVLGNFDGCHKGHQTLIAEALRIKKERNGKVLLITFDPHSKSLMGEPVLKIQTLEEKIEFLDGLGVDGVLLIPFTEEFVRMDKSVFVQDVLVKELAVTSVVIGYNYRFGYKGEGNAQYLEEAASKYGFSISVLEAFEKEGIPVSSTYIRTLLKDGKIEESAFLLGYYPFVTGRVVHGAKEGRKLGFPTANLEIAPEKILPKKGVYLTKVKVGEEFYKGICNIGYQPTFERNKLVVEVHLLDFQEMIYDQKITVSFLKYLRAEKPFKNKKELKAQLEADKMACRNFNLEKA